MSCADTKWVLCPQCFLISAEQIRDDLSKDHKGAIGNDKHQTLANKQASDAEATSGQELEVFAGQWKLKESISVDSDGASTKSETKQYQIELKWTVPPKVRRSYARPCVGSACPQ